MTNNLELAIKLLEEAVNKLSTSKETFSLEKKSRFEKLLTSLKKVTDSVNEDVVLSEFTQENSVEDLGKYSIMDFSSLNNGDDSSKNGIRYLITFINEAKIRKTVNKNASLDELNGVLSRIIAEESSPKSEKKVSFDETNPLSVGLSDLKSSIIEHYNKEIDCLTEIRKITNVALESNHVNNEVSKRELGRRIKIIEDQIKYYSAKIEYIKTKQTEKELFHGVEDENTSIMVKAKDIPLNLSFAVRSYYVDRFINPKIVGLENQIEVLKSQLIKTDATGKIISGTLTKKQVTARVNDLRTKMKSLQQKQGKIEANQRKVTNKKILSYTKKLLKKRKNVESITKDTLKKEVIAMENNRQELKAVTASFDKINDFLKDSTISEEERIASEKKAEILAGRIKMLNRKGTKLDVQIGAGVFLTGVDQAANDLISSAAKAVKKGFKYVVYEGPKQIIEMLKENQEKYKFKSEEEKETSDSKGEEPSIIKPKPDVTNSSIPEKLSPSEPIKPAESEKPVVPKPIDQIDNSADLGSKPSDVKERVTRMERFHSKVKESKFKIILKGFSTINPQMNVEKDNGLKL